MNQEHREKSSHYPFAQVPSNIPIGSKTNSLDVSTGNNEYSSFTDIRDKAMTERLGEERMRALWQAQGKIAAHYSKKSVDNDNEHFLQDNEDNCSSDGSESSLSGRFRRAEERFDRNLYSFYRTTWAFSSPPPSPASITLSSTTDESDNVSYNSSDDDESGYTGLVDLRKELDQAAVELSFELNELGEDQDRDLPSTPEHIPELSSETDLNKFGHHSPDSSEQNHLPMSKNSNREKSIPISAWYYLGFGRVANVGMKECSEVSTVSSRSFSHFVPQNQDSLWSFSHALVPKAPGTATCEHSKTHGPIREYVVSSSPAPSCCLTTTTAAVCDCNPPTDVLTLGEDALLKPTQIQEEFSSTIPHLADFDSLSLINEYSPEAEEAEEEERSISNIEVPAFVMTTTTKGYEQNPVVVLVEGLDANMKNRTKTARAFVHTCLITLIVALLFVMSGSCTVRGRVGGGAHIHGRIELQEQEWSIQASWQLLSRKADQKLTDMLGHDRFNEGSTAQVDHRNQEEDRKELHHRGERRRWSCQVLGRRRCPSIAGSSPRRQRRRRGV